MSLGRLLQAEKGIANTLRRLALVTLCSLVLLVARPVIGVEQELSGCRSDGSRYTAVHVVPLVAEPPFDEETGPEILPSDEVLLPFSPRQTCSNCHICEHSYEVIRGGWHFNATDSNVPPGRPGEPWILVDHATATQIPLSYRPWRGTFRPQQLGMTAFEFTQLFGRHMPGGGVGEIESDNIDEIARQLVSGKLEINCLMCHEADPAYDLAEYASQIGGQNFRWAATAACGFASVSGSAKKMEDTFEYTMPEEVDDPELIPQVPTVTYRPNTFNKKNDVFFDIVRGTPDERCYFCHSNMNVTEYGSEKWMADEDVHLTAGMSCVDCHREGLEHNTIRGYEGEDAANKLAVNTTCDGCHSGTGSSEEPEAGRLGAPVPTHPGIPPVHFERLTCTACHCGPWPGQQTHHVKTSRAHALGAHNVNKSADALPHISFPVLAEQQDGSIAPHKVIWPAYWGVVTDQGVAPADLEIVKRAVGGALAGAELSRSGDWPALTREHIAEGLKSLQKAVEGGAVYVAGGILYRLDETDELSEEPDHPAAAPYMWPIAHNVRPAAQSLGVRRCEDCHATDAAFFFGNVAVDSPIALTEGDGVEMVEFQGVDRFYAWAFAFSFVFRPWLKIVALGSCAVMGLVLLLYGLRALTGVVRVLSEQE